MIDWAGDAGLEMDILIEQVKDNKISLPPELKGEKTVGVAWVEDPKGLMLMSEKDYNKCRRIVSGANDGLEKWQIKEAEIITPRIKIFDNNEHDCIPVDLHSVVSHEFAEGSKCIILKPYYNSYHLILGTNSLEYQTYEFLRKRVGKKAIYRVKPFIGGNPIGSFFTKMLIGENEEYVEGHICPPHSNSFMPGMIEMSTERCHESFRYGLYKEGETVESQASFAWDCVINRLAKKYTECHEEERRGARQFWYAYMI